jgi:chorismate-pyruvate lyase
MLVSAHLSAGLVKSPSPTAEIMTPSVPWIGLDDFLKSDDAAGMDPALRMVLTSDGTITTLLRALCLCPIQMEVLRQEEIKLSAAEAEFLSVKPDSSALAREVWLTAKGQRLVCASSVIRMEGLDRTLLQALRNREKPLGRLLYESGLPVLRDRLQIASFADPARIKSLGLTGSGPVWMRRYRMSLKSKSIALISEQFIGPPFRSGK